MKAWTIAAGGLCLCALVCAAAGQPNGPSLGNPPLVAVDGPVRGARVQDIFLTRGWAVSEDGIDSVAIYIDHALLAYAVLGGERKDVRKIYPKIQGSGQSGWQFEAAAALFPPGRHEISVEAKSRKGATARFGPVLFYILQ